MRFLDHFSKTRREEFNQEDWSVSDTFGIITSCSAAYHLEVRAPVSLKPANTASFGGKNCGNLHFYATFPKQKWRSVTKKKKFI